MADFTAIDHAGLPHAVLKLSDGRPVYDALGPGYTLLRLDSEVAVMPLVQAMRDHGVPVEVVDVETSGSNGAYDRKLILVRTDQHVAWRGDALPDQRKLFSRSFERQDA